MRAALVWVLFGVLGCAGQSPASTQTSASTTDTTRTIAAEPVASAAAPSASAPPLASAKAPSSASVAAPNPKAAGAEELAMLDAQILEALAPEVPTSNVLSGPAGLDLAVQGGRGGGSLQMGAGGVAGTGSLAALAERKAPPARIGGKKPGEATTEDVAKATVEAGCTPSRRKDGASPAVFDVACGTHAFVVTFLAKGVTLDPAKLTALEKDAAVFSEDGARLIVQPGPGVKLAAAQTLANKLHGDPTVVTPNPKVSIGAITVTGSAVDNATSVVAGMAAGFRRCFNRGLKDDPDAKGGTLTLSLTIGKTGEVSSSMAKPGSSVPKLVVSCAQARAASAQFAAPEKGAAQIAIQITFQPE